MNPTNNTLVNLVVEGIREKKGHRISIVDLRSIETAPCEYFVVATGNSPQQVEAMTESVEDVVREKGKEKPAAVAGLDNAYWVAMDYGNVMVHHLLPEAREHYDIEHLWDDAELQQLPDED
ncbi:MAG: ribosome silencing factor [Alloprevotella sp.]